MSKTPTLFDSISQAAREDREAMSKLDERWDRLAAGTLTEAENDELLGLADASGEAFEAYQAFKPLGPSFQKNVAAAILAQQGRERDAALAATESAADSPPPHPPASTPPKRKLIFGSLGGLLGVAMAALFFFPLTQTLSLYEAKTLAHIPAARSGTAVSPETGVPVFYPGNDITVEADTTAKNGELEARLYALGADGRLQPTRFVPQIAEKGSTVSFGPLALGRDLVLDPGPWQLLMVIARPGKLPDEAAIRQALPEDGPTSSYWQVLAFAFEVAPRPSLDELEVR